MLTLYAKLFTALAPYMFIIAMIIIFAHTICRHFFRSTKFIVTRTSGTWDNSERPLDGAKYELINNKHTWFMNVGSLKELIDLVKREGKIVVSEHHFPNQITIEIYDDYRE